MAISSPGIGSGLNVADLVTQLMAVERAPLNALDKKEVSFQAKLSVFGTLKGTLSSLQSAAQALSTPAKAAPVKASVADTSVLSATVGDGAVAGNYNIEVVSLAESQKLLTGGFASTSTAIGTVGKKITIDFGSYGGGTPPTEFTANADKASKTFTIDASNNSLTGLRDAINGANMGVSASIINDGTNYRLALTSLETGAKNALKISVDDDSLKKFAFDARAAAPDPDNMLQTVAAKDAQIKVDTILITKPSNTITDAIQGITLNLTKETPTGVTTKLTTTKDTAALQSAIQNFVKMFNDANKTLNDVSAYDPATGKTAVLNGDSTVRSIQSQLRKVFSTPVPGAPAGSSVLSDIGISFQRDGTLAIDSTKLSAALSNPNKSLPALFAGTASGKGYAAEMEALVGRITSPVGLLADKSKSINTSLQDISKKRVEINRQLVLVEKRYRAQFTALDQAVSSMQQTSTYLTQQLKSLASLNEQ